MVVKQRSCRTTIIFVLLFQAIRVDTIQINDTTKTNINLMLQNFAFPCEYFTDIMAIKHALQHSVFNQESNVTDKTAADEVAVLLSYLQTLADILQKAKV